MINKVYIEYLLLKEDKTSIEEVIAIIQPKLLSFALTILKSPYEAQDAVQESLISIIKGIAKLKNHRKFHAWIYQVTRNKCLDSIRHNKKHQNDCDLDTVTELKSTVTNQDDSLDLINFIQQLPNNQKNVVHLFYYDGFNIREIAHILEKPAGTIKSLLFDAREHLKQLFGE
jgi:RNA polymerase sigma-70 factor (ECF subfamily)